ncbi:AAA domain-containing protein/AAA_assoc domain-containing protein [Cephalotus follicularis]|uniref:AAA domain-containing protein/AAA_assoc domain-containing protein n=1 Tax=Cephalotus follicularis TaxID=3775 RepID=A0A1Q3CBY0_CEPFO|nr:AAA domain-containing protein/AAA_assoc domain-containing protein [Cephalotus follicularis]
MEILSQMWSLLGLLTVLQNILPSQLLSLLNSLYESLQDLFSPYSYFEIPEFNGYCGVDVNDLYRQVNLYLNSVNPSAAAACRRLTLSRSKSSNRISFTVAPNHTVHDAFCGHTLSWTHHVDTVQDSLDEKRSFTLKLPKRHRQALLSPYLDHVTSCAEEFERVSRERRLFTNNGHGSYESGWVSVPFRHPSTFDTMALEPAMKKQITEDLTAFSRGKEFYHRVGRAWKRGYLLYGLPGSGKSSLIAAMANYLCYDVYDLELTKVTDNSELRALLIQTTNRSIIVIEDIDCSLDLTADRVKKKSSSHEKEKGSHPSAGDVGDENNGRVTLSGLLNFTDGLWSCCGEERIIVFTTNHRDNVDSALVRCGRMDVHVSLGTCGMHAFRVLAKNYLDVESHASFHVVESCISSGGALTPAQIGEVLLRNRGDADLAIKEVVSAMQMQMQMKARILGNAASQNYCRDNNELIMDQYCEDMVAAGTRSPESVLMVGSPENWDSSPGKIGFGGRKRKESSGSNWEKKAKFLVRLRSLTKSDSATRGV